MISTRRVEFHPVELEHLGDLVPRRDQFGIGHIMVEPGVSRSAVIRCDHPGEAMLESHLRVRRRGVYAVGTQKPSQHARSPAKGRGVAETEAAVYVVVAREPGPVRGGGCADVLGRGDVGYRQDAGRGHDGDQSANDHKAEFPLPAGRGQIRAHMRTSANADYAQKGGFAYLGADVESGPSVRLSQCALSEVRRPIGIQAS